MKYLHFIVNPISGKGNHVINKELLVSIFPENEYRIEISHTEGKDHAKTLAVKAVKNGADCVIACGGDGTVNEVASALIGSQVPLGIVPVGSGNGLASNLGIKGSLQEVITTIKKQDITVIDSGCVNDNYFFSNAGLGIDAEVIKKYEQKGKRKLWAYIVASLEASLSFKHYNTTIKFGDKELDINPFLLFISNSNQMGYDMSLTPQAKLNDGYLNLVTAPKMSFLQKMKMGFLVLNRNFLKFKAAQHNLTQSLTIYQPERIYTDIQIDGEYHSLKTNYIHIEIIPASLKVIC
ncbi:diacylglycerol kinase family protein [Flavobacterium rakeshii]|uniref:diacylglycerol/lipid kinase family protein n=1 Tax=Flavobacterium rakeshii TaxID=1038845 RepID=UPI002E7C52C5|nr:diacylglycerol kinase family protein [Flavobacterium rakeshii]MEE1898235.1 diacylglycerol kinase family protein [Flavobacterium rakeshii]